MKLTPAAIRLLCAFALLPVIALAQVVPPVPKSTKSPVYPLELTDTGLSGMTVIELMINADGTVTNPSVVSADHSAFGTAALEVVREWVFEPGQRDGHAVAMKVHLPFSFSSPLEERINAALKRKVFQTVSEPILSEEDFGLPLKVKRQPKPVYPKGYLPPKTFAGVEIDFVVTPEGKTINPHFVGRPDEALMFPAMATIAQTTYVPPVKDGERVYVKTSTTVKFLPTPARRGDGSGAGDFDGDPIDGEDKFGLGITF